MNTGPNNVKLTIQIVDGENNGTIHLEKQRILISIARYFLNHIFFLNSIKLFKLLLLSVKGKPLRGGGVRAMPLRNKLYSSYF